MKKIRILIIIVFAIVTAVFIGYRWWEKKTSDFKGPVISAESDKLEASVNITDEELLQGMTAVDNLDGDVTSTLVVASRTKFIRKNTVKVNYAAFDKNNNVGTFVRELTYTDYVPPRFSVNAPLCYVESDTRNTAQILRNITAYDCIDGDITSQITFNTGDLRTIDEGVKAQTISLMVSNRSGDTGVVDLEIRFEDYNIFNQQKPHLSAYLVYVKAGEARPNFIEYADGIGFGNNVTSFADAGFERSADLRVNTSRIDFETPGTYQAVYTLSQRTEDGRRAELGSTHMTVVVEE